MALCGAAPRPVLSALHEAFAQGGSLNVAAGAQDLRRGTQNVYRRRRYQTIGNRAAAGAQVLGSGYPRRQGVNLVVVRGSDDESPALRHEAERHQSKRMAAEAGGKNLEKRAILMRASKDGPTDWRPMGHMEERTACRWFSWNGHRGSSVDPSLASKEDAVRHLIRLGCVITR